MTCQQRIHVADPGLNEVTKQCLIDLRLHTKRESFSRATTMEQFTSISILLSSLVLTGLGLAQSLQWEEFSGRIPTTGLQLLTGSKDPRYLCRVREENSYGVMGTQDSACNYTDSQHQRIFSSSRFDILVRPGEKVEEDDLVSGWRSVPADCQVVGVQA